MDPSSLPWVGFVVGALFVVTFLITVTGLTIEPPGEKHFVKVATVEAFEQESLGDFFKSVFEVATAAQLWELRRVPVRKGSSVRLVQRQLRGRERGWSGAPVGQNELSDVVPSGEQI